jgi:Rrf2 family protein
MWPTEAGRSARWIPVRITARGDYAVRVALELAATQGQPTKVGELAARQNIPPRFLENILVALRRAGLVHSRRGTDGGFWLALPASEISVADVLRAAEGPLADIQGFPPEEVSYGGAAASLRDVWVAARASLRAVLERVTLADIVARSLPGQVTELLVDPESWHVHLPLGGNRRGAASGALATADGAEATPGESGAGAQVLQIPG